MRPQLRHTHPFGRENEVSIQQMLKAFANHVSLGQWELARACINELCQQEESLPEGISVQNILYTIAKNPYGLRLVHYFSMKWIILEKYNYFCFIDLPC